VVPVANNLFAGDEVIINITGRISKFVRIESSKTTSNVDLESVYNLSTGELPSSEFSISQISAYSNSSEGYKMIIDTSNNFNMRNNDGLSIQYSLKFEGGDSLPTNAFFYEVGANSEIILNSTGGSSFAENQLLNSDLVLTTERKENFLVGDESFNDSIKLSIISN